MIEIGASLSSPSRQGRLTMTLLGSLAQKQILLPFPGSCTATSTRYPNVKEPPAAGVSRKDADFLCVGRLTHQTPNSWQGPVGDIYQGEELRAVPWPDPLPNSAGGGYPVDVMRRATDLSR